MIAVSFHRSVSREMVQAEAWYRERSSEAAERFVSAIDTAVTRINDDPTSFAIEYRQCRTISVAGYPFQLIFEPIDDHRVLILAVAHTSRRPGYWKDREPG